MNVSEINPGTTGTLITYMVIALPLTLIIVWIAGFPSASSGGDAGSIFKRVIWPMFSVLNIIKKWRKPKSLDSLSYMMV